MKTIEEAPYAVQKRYAQDRYFKTFAAARKAVLKDLTNLLGGWTALQVADSQEATRALIRYVEDLKEGPVVHIDGIIDPCTQMRYRAQIVRRGEDW